MVHLLDETTNRQSNSFWKVLIVDDDNFIHRLIKEINKGIIVEDKYIKFYSAYSSQEAIDILKENPDMALILLDVFLENKDSGLRLARDIRHSLNIKDSRIVLITGKGSKDLQDAVVLNYDINGYENKSELFSKKMNTVIISAIRSYRDLIRIKSNRLDMEKIIFSMSSLYEKDTIEDFINSYLFHLGYLINQCKNRVKCHIDAFAAVRCIRDKKFKIVGGHGMYFGLEIGQEIEKNSFPKEEYKIISRAYEGSGHTLTDDYYTGIYKSNTGDEALIYIKINEDIDLVNRELLDIFHTSVSASFESLCLRLEIEATQKEILYTLGEVTEARSAETGSHVKRVSKYCNIIGREYGLSKRQLMLLTNASPIHDIGKIAIPDEVLLKPGKLTDEEFNLMKTHTTVGYNLLKNSNREILKAASIVAYEHHEKWDGTGYPRGLKGEEIHIYGRITALADVFDALGAERTYKKAWPVEKILNFFKEERGRHFDPELVDILFDNIDEILEVREKYEDIKG